jgi:transposase InsO family protein
MKNNHPEVGLGRICKLFGKTRQAFYDISWYTADQQLEEAVVVDLIKQHRSLWDGGAVKLHKILKPQLQAHHISMGRPGFLKLLSAQGLLLPKRKRKYAITTDSDHPFKKWPDMTGGLEVKRPGQLWVSDITYINTERGFNYLSLVTDAYSRKIIGYHLSQNLRAQGAIIALKKAIKSLPAGPVNLIHHSDRGIQYCCSDYVEILQSHEINISMTQSGSPYDNAIAERVNGILKREFHLRKTFASYPQAVDAVNKAIDYYNRVRPHMSCNDLTPNQAHLTSGVLKRKWKAKKKVKTTEIEV